MDEVERRLQRILDRTKPVYESAIEDTISKTLAKFHDGDGWKGNAYHTPQPTGEQYLWRSDLKSDGTWTVPQLQCYTEGEKSE